MSSVASDDNPAQQKEAHTACIFIIGNKSSLNLTFKLLILAILGTTFIFFLGKRLTSTSCTYFCLTTTFLNKSAEGRRMTVEKETTCINNVDQYEMLQGASFHQSLQGVVILLLL